MNTGLARTCCPGCPPDCLDCPTRILAGSGDLDDAEALFSLITETTEWVTTRSAVTRRNWSDLADRWVTAPVIGPLIFLAVMWGVFPLTTRAAAPLQDALDALLAWTWTPWRPG